MMGHFGEVARFELRYHLRRLSTWVYFGIFFVLAALLVMMAGGAFESGQVSFGGSGGKVYVNSPYAIANLSASVSLFTVIVTAAIVGHAVVRDFDAGIAPLFFTTPVRRLSFLGGRFVGAVIANLIILASIPLGLMAGGLWPALDRAKFGAFDFFSYAQPFLVFQLPNLLVTGAIFFVLAALTRRMLPNYVGGIFLLLGYLLLSQFLDDVDNDRLASLLDPFGLAPYGLASRYWTPAEQNRLPIPLDELMLMNRGAWLALALLLFLLGVLIFRPGHAAGERKPRARKGKKGIRIRPAAPPSRTLPQVHPTYGLATQRAQFASIARQSFLGIVRNRYFAAIVAGGIVFMAFMSTLINDMYGTPVWPVTYAVLEVVGDGFGLFMMVIITLYAGDLVWHERDAKISQVVDATPVRSWVPMVGKWAGLALMVASLEILVTLTGMAIQASQGYFNFEPGVYLMRLLGMDLLDWMLLAGMAMLMHVLVNHKYVGHVLFVLFIVGSGFLSGLGFEHTLYTFASGSQGIYSDMNGFGPFPARFYWLKAYWFAWAILLALVSNLFWVRGQESGMRWRVRLARRRFGVPAASALALGVLLVVSLGGFIFYNTNVLNEYASGNEMQERVAGYERTYKRYEGIAQPRVTGVDLRVELYPERRRAEVTGTYRLRNVASEAIQSVHVNVPSDLQIDRMAFDRVSSHGVKDDVMGYHIFTLMTPLEPGDSMQFEFGVALAVEGFANDESMLSLVENGSFLNSGFLPSFGYDPDAELASDDARRKQKLPPKERMAPLEDTAALRNNYVSGDGDWIDFAMTVGTSADQIALAPGYLRREWEDEGRRYFRYEMDAPILNFYSVLSARYVVARDRWRDLPIEVYHHPGHEYNVQRMIDAVKKSLDYYTAEFGPYQHRQVRILEFPRYQTFAQSFPNTIPYSEGVGFIARLRNPDSDVDYPFYVTAHEVAHQWWAHQVIGGNVQGSTLLSETLSQYSAMMVMEKEYGREQVDRFLSYEMDNYLQGRGFEQKKESPLLRVEGQAYIHYNKGAVVMYALRDLIGERALNGALRDFLTETKFMGPPYPTSTELYQHLLLATPDSLKGMVADMFERITLYDNRVVAASAVARPDGAGYRVTIDLESRKFYADSLGNASEAEMSDWVDVGVFAEGDSVLYLKKQRLTTGPRQVIVDVSGVPAKVGVDPYYKLIDRTKRDNTAAVEVQPSSPDRPAPSG